MNITIYSTTNCGVCHAEMRWLDGKSIRYTNKIVDEDAAAMEEFMKVNEGMIGTPFTVIEDSDKTSKIAGFDRSKLESALGL